MQAQHVRVDRLPLPVPFYVKSVLGQRQYQEGQSIPPFRVEWPHFSFSEASARAYAKVCATPFDGKRLPLLYPHSYFGPLHLLMLTDESFPLRVLGSVHIRNHVLQHEPLLLSERYDAELFIMDQRRRPQGMEVDFRTEVKQGSETKWESVTTILFRRKFRELDTESPRAQVLQNLQDAAVKARFAVPRFTGKQFAWITKDFNPIHMSPYLAKLFGFKRDICHGMWALARSLVPLDGIDWQKPVRNDVIFKGPLFIGHDITVKQSQAHPELFEVYSEGNERPCMLGRLQNVGPQERL